MTALLLIPFGIVLGILLRRSGLMGASGARILNQAIIFVSLPALTLLQIHGLSQVSFAPAAMAWLLYLGAIPVFLTAARAFGFSRGTVGALLLTAGLGNTSFLGFPILLALYGESSLKVAIVADQLGTFLALSTVGLLTASVCSATQLSFSAVAGKVLLFPPFLALLAALLLRGTGFSPAVSQVLTLLASTLAPLALVSVGYQLKLDRASLARNRRALFIGLGYKLALGPALVASVFFAASRNGAVTLSGEALRVVILEAAMAPMITGSIVATESALDPELASLLIGVGIPLSFLTLPLWIWIIGGL